MPDKKITTLINPNNEIMHGETVLDMFKVSAQGEPGLTAQDVLVNLGMKPEDDNFITIADTLEGYVCKALPNPNDNNRLDYGLKDVKQYKLATFVSGLTASLARKMGVDDAQVQTAAAIFFLVDWAASLDVDTFKRLPVSAVIKLEDLHNYVNEYRQDDAAWKKVSSYLSGESGEKIAEILLSAESVVDSPTTFTIPDAQDRSAAKMATRLQAYKDSMTPDMHEEYDKQRGVELTAEAANRCLEGLYDSQVYVKWQELVHENPAGMQQWLQSAFDSIGGMPLLQTITSSVPGIGDAGRDFANKGQEFVKSTQSYGYNWQGEVTDSGLHPAAGAEENSLGSEEWKKACDRVFSDENAKNYGIQGSLAKFGLSGNEGVGQYYLTSEKIQELTNIGVEKAQEFVHSAVDNVCGELEKGTLASLTECYSNLALAYKVGEGLKSFDTQLNGSYTTMLTNVETSLSNLTGKETANSVYLDLAKQVDRIKSEHQYNEVIQEIKDLQTQVKEVNQLNPYGDNKDAIFKLATQAKELLITVQKAEKKPFYYPSQLMQWLLPKLYDFLSRHKAQNQIERRGVKQNLRSLMTVIRADEVKTEAREKKLETGGSQPNKMPEKVRQNIENEQDKENKDSI